MGLGLALAAAVLVLAGAAVQVVVGAGLSVVCGAFLMLMLGPPLAVPMLLVLNLLLSIAATAKGLARVRWRDVAAISAAAVLGSAVAGSLPPLPDRPLKAATAAVLAAAALRRPRPSGPAAPGSSSLAVPVGAGIASGLLTVWTATPGPVVPIALSRAGRDGDQIRRAMQPISIVGYGIGIVWLGLAPTSTAIRHPAFAPLLAATLAGTALGFRLRHHVDAERVTLLVRLTAGLAAAALVASLMVAA